MAYPSDIDLLLLGKTGTGKSATGNSILGFKAFESKCTCESVTTYIQSDVTEFNGKVIKVVDGPGVGDTRLNNKEAVEMIIQRMEYAISLNPRGYHAFLLVVRFGGRFTEEDRDAVSFLKRLFGDDFVAKFCILVMTCGDNFDKEDGKTFEQWCTEQQGVFKSLLRECNQRIILFNNRTSNKQQKDDQLQRLIFMVGHLGSQGHRYTNVQFEQARRARQRVMVEEKEALIREETMVETRLILRQFHAIQRYDPEVKVEALEALCQRTQDLCENVSAEDQGTGALHKLTQTVKSLLRTVDEEIKLANRMVQEKQRMEMQMREQQRQMAEQLKWQQEQYERELRERKIAEGEYRQWCIKLEKKRRQEDIRRERDREKLLWKHEQEVQKMRERCDYLDNEYKKIKTDNESNILVRTLKGLGSFVVKAFGLFLVFGAPFL